ncbi:bile acid:sodium symporter, partial [Micrococcus sp. HG099]|uniref:bile acid:sodium symporter n=1 Tax=Micrococcus sp. HG099 TaxID=2969755 RepID=UPI00215A6A11
MESAQSRRAAMVAWMERHQAALYAAGIAAGAVVGWAVPGAGRLAVLVEPVLGLLLLATFLAVPFAALGAALRDVRFLAALLVLNFAVVPAVVFGLSRFAAHDDALLVGVLLVLLAPCVDYVIAFTGLAGGAAERLLAAAPLLMLLQLLLLPVLLRAFAGPAAVAAVDVGPFVRALVLLILLPLALAALVQGEARRGAPGPHEAHVLVLGHRREPAGGLVQGPRQAQIRAVHVRVALLVPVVPHPGAPQRPLADVHGAEHERPVRPGGRGLGQEPVRGHAAVRVGGGEPEPLRRHVREQRAGAAGGPRGGRGGAPVRTRRSNA